VRIPVAVLQKLALDAGFGLLGEQMGKSVGKGNLSGALEIILWGAVIVLSFMLLDCLGWISLNKEVTVGEAITGVGTLALAVFTWRMATRASSQIEASEKQVEASKRSILVMEEQLQSEVRPWIVLNDVPGRPGFSTERGHLDFHLVNVGRGAGLLADIRIVADSVDYVESALGPVVPFGPGEERSAERRLVAPGQINLIEHLEMPHGANTASLTFYYVNSFGQRYGTTYELYVRPDIGQNDAEFPILRLGIDMGSATTFEATGDSVPRPKPR
ncbi:MAG: hypothetical protein KDB63_23040, partial [Nocardioidaceae bacterium]|nr:hypothetical protein [Nocardioidaceae bacterium]